MISEQIGKIAGVASHRQRFCAAGYRPGAQFVQNRDAVDHIATGQLDQQDLAEFLEGKLAKAPGQPSSHESKNFL